MKRVLVGIFFVGAMSGSLAANSNPELDYLTGNHMNSGYVPPNIQIESQNIQSNPPIYDNNVYDSGNYDSHNQHEHTNAYSGEMYNQYSDQAYLSDSNHSFSSEEAQKISQKSLTELFKECIFKSDQMIDVLNVLRTIPENDRIKTLIESGYWEALNSQEKDKTMRILANFNGVNDDQHDIIKGQIADSLKEECINLVKR